MNCIGDYLAAINPLEKEKTQILENVVVRFVKNNYVQDCPLFRECFKFLLERWDALKFAEFMRTETKIATEDDIVLQFFY